MIIYLFIYDGYMVVGQCFHSQTLPFLSEITWHDISSLSAMLENRQYIEDASVSYDCKDIS